MKDYSSIRVLVIDDEPAICLSLTAFLEDYGFKASSAESAEEALDLMKNNEFMPCLPPRSTAAVSKALTSAQHPLLLLAGWRRRSGVEALARTWR